MNMSDMEYRSGALCLDKLNVNGNIIENIQDPEGRTEIKIDSECKILSYRDSDGVMHECGGLEVNSLFLTDTGLTALKETLGISASNILHVKKDVEDAYNSVTEAVAAAHDGDIIFIHNGIYDNEAVKARNKNLTIIGEDRYGVQIKGAGDYLDPPFEMASGYLGNVSVYAYGETPAPNGRYAYAIHADYEILANNHFIVENCTLKTKMGHGAVGMGLRGGCYVLFKDCDFICEHEAGFFMNETVTAPDWNQTPGDQHFEFNNCKFINEDSDKSVTGRFEGYHSREGLVYATFINNVFVHNGRIPYVYFYWPSDERYWDPQCENIEGNIVVDSQGNKMINWFITEASYGNNIPSLNYAKEGTLNGLTQ